MPPQSTLIHAIERARLAVAARSLTVTPQPEHRAPSPSVRVRVVSPQEGPRHFQSHIDPHATFEAPSRPSQGETVAELLQSIDLSPAERRLFALLHRLALGVARARGYAAVPSRIVFHVPAVLLALAFGTSRRRLYQVLPGLVDAGLLAFGGQAEKVGDVNLYGGCLWAVRMRLDAPAPRIRREEWQHRYRDFEGDLKGGRTAAALGSHLQDEHADSEKIFAAVLRLAVDPRNYNPPVEVGANPPSATAREVVFTLPALLEATPGERQRLVGVTASILARELRDTGSRRLYAWALHRAYEAEHRGIRALSALQHALTRLLADLAEWGELRRPGALFVARLKAAGVWDSLTS